MPNIDLRSTGVTDQGPDRLVVGANGYSPADAGKPLVVLSDGSIGVGTTNVQASYFQWRGQATDNLAAAQPLLPTDGTHTYAVDFNTSEWAFSEAGGLPPRMIYSGAQPRLFHVIVNPHFESLASDGDAHLPFMNLFQGVTAKHHSHASVIVDVPPVLESMLATATLLLMAPGDYITLQYGSDNINPVATAIQTDFFVVAFAV